MKNKEECTCDLWCMQNHSSVAKTLRWAEEAIHKKVLSDAFQIQSLKITKLCNDNSEK